MGVMFLQLDQVKGLADSSAHVKSSPQQSVARLRLIM